MKSKEPKKLLVIPLPKKDYDILVKKAKREYMTKAAFARKILINHLSSK